MFNGLFHLKITTVYEAESIIISNFSEKKNRSPGGIKYRPKGDRAWECEDSHQLSQVQRLVSVPGLHPQRPPASPSRADPALRVLPSYWAGLMALGVSAAWA